MKLRLLVLASLLPTTWGCSVKIADQEVQARIDPRDGSLELLLIYRGVTASKEDADTLKDAVKIATQVSEGRRVWSILGWPFSGDLDDGLKDLLETDAKAAGREAERTGTGAGAGASPGPKEEDWTSDPQIRKLAIAVNRSISLVEHGGFLDDEGRLSAYQVFRIERFPDAVKLWSDVISDAVLRGAKTEKLKEDTPLLDDRTRELFIEKAKRGEPWVKLEGGEIAIDLPMNRETYERLRAAYLDDLHDTIAVKKNRRTAGMELQLLAHLRHLEFSGERLRMRFGAPPGGIIRWSENPGEAYDTRLLDALKAKGIRPDESLKLEDVRGKLARLPAAQKAPPTKESPDKPISEKKD